MVDYVNILCLYWIGEFRGRDFTENDVWRLYENVCSHIDRDFYFYPLTNDIDANLPGEPILLHHNWPGWWSKMELHRGDLPRGRSLYFDLDTHILRAIDPLFEYEGDLVMFNTRSKGSAVWEGGRKQVHRYQAATMLFTSGKQEWFYNVFKKDPQYYMNHYRSEQDLMGEMMPNLDTFPDAWLTKASRVRDVSDETIIVTGQPKRKDWRTVV